MRAYEPWTYAQLIVDVVDRWGKYASDGYVRVSGKEYAIVYVMVCHAEQLAWLVMNNKQTQGLTEYAIPYIEGGEPIGRRTEEIHSTISSRPEPPVRVLRESSTNMGSLINAGRNEPPILPRMPIERIRAIQRDSGDRMDGWMGELERAAREELPKHAKFAWKKRGRRKG